MQAKQSRPGELTPGAAQSINHQAPGHSTLRPRADCLQFPQVIFSHPNLATPGYDTPVAAESALAENGSASPPTVLPNNPGKIAAVTVRICENQKVRR
jgi:hypothetical protein